MGKRQSKTKDERSSSYIAVKCSPEALEDEQNE
jgi:hypothetical protein